MSCNCKEPVEQVNPRFKGTCVKCSESIDGLSTDRQLGIFFERLAEAMFPLYGKTLDKQHLPQWFYNFYRMCSGRERAGRSKFGLAYLARNNPAEAQEEAADLANYAYMEILRRRRLGEDQEEDLALTAAMHAARAYESCQRFARHNYSSLSDDPEKL